MASWIDSLTSLKNVIVKAFYPLLLIVSYKFSIPIHPLGMVRTRGKIIFCKYSFTSYALRVTNILLLAFHSDQHALMRLAFQFSSSLHLQNCLSKGQRFTIYRFQDILQRGANVYHVFAPFICIL